MTRLVRLSIGTAGFILLASLYIAVFESAVWRDGQFILMYFAIVPLGFVCAFTVMFAQEHAAREQRRDAALMAWSGAVATGVLGGVASVTPGLIASAALTVWGTWLLRRAASSVGHRAWAAPKPKAKT